MSSSLHYSRSPVHCDRAAPGRPVAEIMTINFIIVGMDQLVNNAAKIPYMFGGEARCPLVIRTPSGAAHQLTAQHSQVLEVWFAYVPGMYVVAPATPADANGLIKACISDNALPSRT